MPFDAYLKKTRERKSLRTQRPLWERGGRTGERRPLSGTVWYTARSVPSHPISCDHQFLLFRRLPPKRSWQTRRHLPPCRPLFHPYVFGFPPLHPSLSREPWGPPNVRRTVRGRGVGQGGYRLPSLDKAFIHSFDMYILVVFERRTELLLKTARTTYLPKYTPIMHGNPCTVVPLDLPSSPFFYQLASRAGGFSVGACFLNREI